MAKITDKINNMVPKSGPSKSKKPADKKTKPVKVEAAAPADNVSAKETANVPEAVAAKKKTNAQTKAKKAPVNAALSEKAKKNRVVKFMFGIVVLIVFLIFAYISISVAPHTSDIGDDYWPATNYHRGVEREKATTVDVYEIPISADTITEAAQSTEPEVEETSEPAVETSAQETRPEAVKAAALGLPAPPEIDINSWEYLLVNSTHTIDENFRPETFAALNLNMSETDIQTTSDDYSETRCLVDSRIGENLRDFALACSEAGLPVYLSSGYRSYSTQSYLFNRKVGQGYSEDVAKTIVAYPGTSEHQTGLSCDITDRYRETKDSSLAQTDTYKWLCEHCTDYGFVVRYPEDKSGSADSVTGIIYEPWHFRYVGQEVAKYMTENNLCLEEFVALYE